MGLATATWPTKINTNKRHKIDVRYNCGGIWGKLNNASRIEKIYRKLERVGGLKVRNYDRKLSLEGMACVQSL